MILWPLDGVGVQISFPSAVFFYREPSDVLGNNKRSSTQQKAIFLFSFHTELYSWPVQFLRAAATGAAFKFREKERERGTEESAAIVPIVE